MGLPLAPLDVRRPRGAKVESANYEEETQFITGSLNEQSFGQIVTVLPSTQSNFLLQPSGSVRAGRSLRPLPKIRSTFDVVVAQEW